jgi:hypothetical protein
MVRRLLPLLLVLLAGCASAPPLGQVAAPVTVKVPVYEAVYCAIPTLAKPALPIAELHADSAPADTIRAYAATVVMLKGAVSERDAVIAGCKRPQAGPGDTRANPGRRQGETQGNEVSSE